MCANGTTFTSISVERRKSHTPVLLRVVAGLTVTQKSLLLQCGIRMHWEYWCMNMPT